MAKFNKGTLQQAQQSMQDLRDKFNATIAMINTRVIGMPEVVRGIALAILSGTPQFGEHVFMIGSPGVGKSYAMDTWVSCIELMPEAFFDYLLHQFSTPDELVGEYDIKKLLSQHIKERGIEGYLPYAIFAILDEIWKAGPVTTMLFKITNERKFRNGTKMVDCPLITAITASNEYPSNKMDAPLWDRLLFRFKVEAVWDPDGIKAIQAAKRITWNPEKLTLKEIYLAKAAVWAVEVPKDVEEAMIAIHVALFRAGIELSGRRRDKMYSVIRANAWLNGRDVAAMEDIAAIWSCCWEDDKQIKQVRKLIAKISNFELDKLMTQLDVATDLYQRGRKIIDAYQASGGNTSLLENIDELEEKVGGILADIKDKRARLDAANQTEADIVIAKISSWHREMIPLAIKKLEVV
jgi:MoxR-like ATPase